MWCLGLTTRAGTVVVSCTTGKYHDIALATEQYHRYCPGGSFDLRHRWDTIIIAAHEELSGKITLLYVQNMLCLSRHVVHGSVCITCTVCNSSHNRINDPVPSNR